MVSLYSMIASGVLRLAFVQGFATLLEPAQARPGSAIAQPGAPGLPCPQ